MNEVLLNIGAIVEVENVEKTRMLLIVAKRVINFNTMRAWDYYGVPYPDGAIKNRDGDENGYYFNHFEITKLFYKVILQLTS